MLSFDYGSPARRALHRVVVGRTTGAGGVLQWLEVIPEVRPATWPVPVTLLRPTARALFVPGSFTPGESRRGLVTGAAFGFIQTLAG